MTVQPAPLAEQVELFAKSLEEGSFDSVRSALNGRMCCNGQMCGCRGSTVGEYLAWELRQLLADAPASD